MVETIIIIIGDTKEIINIGLDFHNYTESSKIILCSSSIIDIKKDINKKYNLLTSFNTYYSYRNIQYQFQYDNIINSLLFSKKILNKEYKDKHIPNIIICVSKKQLKRTAIISMVVLSYYSNIKFIYNDETMTEEDEKSESILLNKFYFEYKINK
jgi:hypothetical protein